jgi:hypothetical protein
MANQIFAVHIFCGGQLGHGVSGHAPHRIRLFDIDLYFAGRLAVGRKNDEGGEKRA